MLHRFAQLGLMVFVACAAAGAPIQLIPSNARWRVTALVREPPAGWTDPRYDDRGWIDSPAGFSVGYSGYYQAISSFPGWLGNAEIGGLALRHAFTVEDPESIRTLALRLEYEDGFIAWLNGKEILRVGLAPGPVPVWDAKPAVHAAGTASVFDLTGVLPELVRGMNSLAIQVFDASPFGGSSFAWPELRANFLRGPLLQNVGTHTATVTWRSLDEVGALVELRRAGSDGPVSSQVAAPGTNTTVTLTGLAPGSTYEYRIVAGAERDLRITDWAAFTTLRESGAVDFVVVGDTGTETVGQVAIAEALAREKTDLILHVGDIVYPSFVSGRVDLRCLSPFEASLRSTPWFLTFGNHDFYEGTNAYVEAFTLPTNALTGTEEFYSFDHGDVHFASLFVPSWAESGLGATNLDGSRSLHYRWLTNDLASTTKPWKVVFFHQPPRTSGPHALDDSDGSRRSDTEEMQAELLPLLSRYGVQLMFNGHDHDWERFAPTNGLHPVVTGGGGAFLYSVYLRDPTSAQFVSRNHFTRVHVRGAEALVEAVDPTGQVFDQFTIRREAAPTATLAAVWHSVSLPPGATNEDGNVPGETFDLPGPGIAGVSAGSANFGRLAAAVDRAGIHLGLRDLMLWPGQTLALFVGAAGTGGVSDSVGVGRNRHHPLGQLGIRFSGGPPSLVCLLGDEWADGNDPGFVRGGSGLALGQGVFRLTADLEPVPGVVVRQFNRSPEQAPVGGEQNADFAVVTLPWGAVRGVLPGDTLQVSALVLGPAAAGSPLPIVLDAGFLGAARTNDPVDGRVTLQGIPVFLAAAPDGDDDLDGVPSGEERYLGTDPRNPDTDGDGLPDGWEIAARLDPLSGAGDQGGGGDPDRDGYSNAEEFRSGTDPRNGAPTLSLRAKRVGDELRLNWRAMIGRTYVLEGADRFPGGFAGEPLPGFPRVAAATNETAMVPVAGTARWFRLREQP